MPSRVVPAALLALLVVLGVGVSTTGASAEPTASPTPSPTASSDVEPEPSPTCPTVGCLPTVLPSRSATPSPKPSQTQTRTPSPTPKPTRTHRTSSPRPDPTFTGPEEPDGPVSTASLGVGDAPSPAATPETKKSASSTSAKVTKLFGLVLLAAVALGFAGITGLYVTRRRPLH